MNHPLKQWRGRRLAVMAKLFYVDRRIFLEWASRQSNAEGLSTEILIAASQLICLLAKTSKSAALDLAIDLMSLLQETESEHRDTFLHLLTALTPSSSEFVPMAAQRLPEMLRHMDGEACARLLSETIDRFETNPKEADSHLQHRIAKSLDFVKSPERALLRRLSLYARAHSNADLHLRFGSHAGIDGLTLTLPEHIDCLPSDREMVLRLLTASLSAHVSLGAFSLQLDELPGVWPDPRPDELDVERLHRSFSNPLLASDLFGLFEDRRVKAVLSLRCPGLGRELRKLPTIWKAAIQAREEPALVEELMFALWAYGASDDRVEFSTPKQVAAYVAIAEKLKSLTGLSPIAESVEALQLAYPLAASLLRTDLEYRPIPLDSSRPILNTQSLDAKNRHIERRARDLWQKVKLLGMSVNLTDVRDQIKTNYAEVSDFLDRMPPPDGGIVEGRGKSIARENQAKLSVGTEVISASHRYPEWHLSQQEYRENWTAVTEYRPKGVDLHFVERTFSTYALERERLKRLFERLRPQRLRALRGLSDGEEVDFDRLLASRVAQRAGLPPDPRVFINRSPKEHDNAIAFLLDLSSSTNAVATPEGKRIIEIQKESLLLISEAVAATGDAFAVYGYSGFGRDQVAFYVAKDFDEPWGELSAGRIGNLNWKMENRDGAAIRHCIEKLMQTKGKRKIIAILSDGEPLDCGCVDYRDAYARADTKKAILEARQKGMIPFCITVDPFGADYLDEMVGQGRYVVLDDSPRLPEVLPKIIGRLLR